MMAANNEVVPPPCSSCVAGGMERKPITPGLNKTTQDHMKRGLLKREQLIRGQKIFSDQFVSLTEKGRNYNDKGQQRSNLNYVGGTIFVDAATGYMSVKHQVSFTGGETSTSMLDFEREARNLGIAVKGYNTDNGVYTCKEILQKLETNAQILSLSGVSAHHQNGPAENAIKMIT